MFNDRWHTSLEYYNTIMDEFEDIFRSKNEIFLRKRSEKIWGGNLIHGVQLEHSCG